MQRIWELQLWFLWSECIFWIKIKIRLLKWTCHKQKTGHVHTMPVWLNGSSYLWDMKPLVVIHIIEIYLETRVSLKMFLVLQWIIVVIMKQYTKIFGV